MCEGARELAFCQPVRSDESSSVMSHSSSL